MSKSAILVAPLAMFALASAAFGGGPDCEKHATNAAYAAAHKEGCSMTKEECMKHMAEARNNGYLGIRYEDGEEGKSVVKDVLKGSPAEKAGFRSGDVLVALNGIELNEANAGRVKATWKTLKPGSLATYTVKRDGVTKELTPTLGKMPDDVYNAMVAEHMKEHVDVASKN